MFRAPQYESANLDRALLQRRQKKYDTLKAEFRSRKPEARSKENQKKWVSADYSDS
jgi:hypothetical protein